MLCNLLTLQSIVRERLNSDAEVVDTGDVVPSEGQTSSRGHQTSSAGGVNQQSRLATDERIAFCKTFNSSVLDCFHDVEVLYLKDFRQLGIGDESRVGNGRTAIQTSQDGGVVDEDVTDFLTDNHRVRLVATRLKLHRTTSISHIEDGGRVVVVRPLGHFRSEVVVSVSNTVVVDAPNVSSKERRSELLLTVDHQTHCKGLSASRADVQHSIFVGEGLLVKVHAEAINVSKVAVVRDGHADTVYFRAGSQLLDIASAVHVGTVVGVVLIGLTLHTHGREHFVSDEVGLFLCVCQRQVRERLVDMHLRGSQKRHIIIPFYALD